MQASVHPGTFPASHAPRMAPRAEAPKGGPLRSYLSNLSSKKPSSLLPTTKAAAFSDSESSFRSVNLVFSKCAWPRRSARVQAIYESSSCTSSSSSGQGQGWSPNGGESWLDGVEEEEEEEEAAELSETDASCRSWLQKLPRVIYEDEDIIAIDKPVGMSFHPTETSPRGIMATLNALMRLDQLPGSEYNGPLHIVHTLDESTSGVLLFAKSEVAAAALVEQFHRGKVHHYFVALSARRPSKTTGTVRGEVAKGRKGVFKLTAARGRGGKGKGRGGGRGGGSSAVTRFFTTGVSGADGRDLHMLVMKPVTPKRSHQLRSTCKSLGAPVLGDSTYVGAKASEEDRAYLHAAAIRIRLPSLPSTLFHAEDADEDADDEEMTATTTTTCDDDDDDSESCTDAEAACCSAGRVIQIVCAPSEGKEWCAGSAFEEAWRSTGFGEAEAGAREWFPEHDKLLASSLDDLLADGANDALAAEEEDMEEVLHVVDGGVIDVSWEVRRSSPR